MDRDLDFGAPQLERLSYANSIGTTEQSSSPSHEHGEEAANTLDEEALENVLVESPQAPGELVATPHHGTYTGGIETTEDKPLSQKASVQDGLSQPSLSPRADGALREGSVPNLYGRPYIGLLVQYAAIGLLYGTLPRTVYPFLNNYLHMNGYQTLSARVLLTMPWSFKVLLGIVSDCFPLWGSRRRSYMVLGWLICSAMLLVLVASDQGQPYYIDRSLRGVDLSSYSASQLQGRINVDAPNRGAVYIVMMMLASCGYMIADVASDGLVVEYAQREPVATRGNIQSTIYLVRSVNMMISALIVGLGLNGVDYGGSFTWSLNMAQLLLICSLLSLIAIPAALWFVTEPPVEHPPTLQTYLSQLWRLLQNSAMLQILLYRFGSGFFEGFTVTAGDPIQRYWARVHPLNESLFSVLGLAVFSITLYFTKTYGLQWNWRVVISTTLLSVLVIDATVAMLTIWNVIRNQWFWLGTPILEELPAAINFLVSTFVVVEMAEKGNEAAVYGLLTTISNLAAPFASCLSKNVNALFDVSVQNVITDTTHVRQHVMYTFLIAYAMKLVSLCWLILLPRQKEETQRLKRNATTRWWGGVVALIVGVFALVWSVTTNLLSIFPSTACLVVAGGNGC